MRQCKPTVALLMIASKVFGSVPPHVILTHIYASFKKCSRAAQNAAIVFQSFHFAGSTLPTPDLDVEAISFAIG